MRRISRMVAGVVGVAMLSVVWLTAPGDAGACTSFLLDGPEGPLVGKSYDWSLGLGIVLFNKRGVAKRAFTLDPGDRPAEWTSQHASLTFNQYGRELPNGGMNDAGLVVEVMVLSAARYPARDDRPALNELQWIQYQLDNHASVSDVVEHADDVRIASVHARVHYMVCDRFGECAAIEHLDGETVVATGRDMPVKALTNNSYAASLAHLRTYRDPGGDLPAPSGSGSLARFVRAAERTSPSHVRATSQSTERRALETLDDVRTDGFTKWNIVYDPRHLTVRFRTEASPALKTVRMADFDSSCNSAVPMLDIDHPGGGDVSGDFLDYSSQVNATLVAESLRDIGANLPAAVLTRLADLPQTYSCRTTSTRTATSIAEVASVENPGTTAHSLRRSLRQR